MQKKRESISYYGWLLLDREQLYNNQLTENIFHHPTTKNNDKNQKYSQI
ncbi:hypothetical protein IFVP182_C2130004 [Vibrio parahaemolyticus]